ncbi:MAG: glutathione S-transferase family protein [Alphaproteobacteria bacterium]
MYRLYYHPICPYSRKVRVHLSAKETSFELINENFWERKKEFIAMNPAGTMPILFDNSNGVSVSCSSAIIEYIEEKHHEGKNYLGDSFIKRSETRRLQDWFDNKFYNEITKHILFERYLSRFLAGSHSPNSDVLRIARKNLEIHFKYIEFLLETRKYLAGDQISVADFSAASHISVLDYFGDINWHHFQVAKEWYSLIKSHKIFSEVLKDRIPNLTPPEWYSKLDF